MTTNRTPFMDTVDLITRNVVVQASGYELVTETVKTVFCSVRDGVARSEFYAAEKTGHQLSLSVEIWEEEYNGERQIDYNSKRYHIVRVYPTGYGTLECSCEEVLR